MTTFRFDALAHLVFFASGVRRVSQDLMAVSFGDQLPPELEAER
jgi:hypothetical protein